tara:strand:+ start:336 stop:533 length:198 start_codon:yes stop_codon:yes gene_type:complete
LLIAQASTPYELPGNTMALKSKGDSPLLRIHLTRGSWYLAEGIMTFLSVLRTSWSFKAIDIIYYY